VQGRSVPKPIREESKRQNPKIEAMRLKPRCSRPRLNYSMYSQIVEVIRIRNLHHVIYTLHKQRV